MATEKQMAANRENGKKGGVKTPEGKAVVRWNALKHGLLAREAVIDGGDGQENREEFEQLLGDLRASLAPEGALEEMLVEMIGTAYWRLRRVLSWEVGQLRKQLDFGRSAEALEVGDNPPRRPRGWDETCLSRISRELSLKLESSEATVRYESALIRQFYRAMHELERLQKARQGIATPGPISVDVDLAPSNP